MLVGFIEAQMETWESIKRSYKLKEGDKNSNGIMWHEKGKATT